MEKLVNFVDSNIKTKEPGFCVKAVKVNSENKFFINFCHSTSVSPPTLILNEKDLQFLIDTESEDLSKFSVPLIIQDVETTTDKKGKCAQVTYAIMNSKFYHDNISSSNIYKHFLIYVTIEIINTKFGVKLDQTSCVILKNKHFQLADNRNAFDKFISPYAAPKILPTLDPSPDDSPMSIESTCENENILSDNVRINLDLKQDNVEIAIKMDNSIQYDNLTLQLGEDQVVVEHKNIQIKHFYLSVIMKVNQASATFKNHILRIKCPVYL